MAAAALTRRNFFGHVGGAYTAVAMGAGATVAIYDPMLTFLSRWYDFERKAGNADHDEADRIYAELVSPIELQAARGDVPETASIKGAAAALRRVINADDLEDMDASLVRSALAFLEAQAA